uniref:LAGLIDADG endonuclease n=1 Tax=Synchytrium endobioticum TaxID=286115 RepID=A0A4P8NNM2_9FUNG|nr:LAGLIDADG endonuclease [Synchytrium endobioticum]QCQ68579.1 LAGLIDADG endonuclease [Synchytrium endobioticum]QCQ68598.1 LAGLIDADG endonuclease [Synchytrium endobioticum]QCQ68769.1 LAGLIDADG endonuclease [Synchytrium endobioticum]QCQ68788.1 LAGLIDADG endonuclease [Synchytrium endobioticum]QCQ68845.1 LAGLIDADG endonuclease [Synchytrium endobioticum]
MIIGSIKPKSYQRIGPHNLDVLSFIFGALLSDAHAERHGKGTRIALQQESSNLEFLTWYNNFLADKGYGKTNEGTKLVKLKCVSRLGENGKRRYGSLLKSVTYTYSSFNWIHECFYSSLGLGTVPLSGTALRADPARRARTRKIVPSNEILKLYLSPLALAIWIMGDGSSVSSGCKLCTNSYTKLECLRICVVMDELYGIKASVNSAGVPNQWVIYIWTRSMPLLRSLVKPYLVPSMYLKLNIQNAALHRRTCPPRGRFRPVAGSRQGGPAMQRATGASRGACGLARPAPLRCGAGAQ